MPNDNILWTQNALYAMAKAAALEAIQSQGGLALPCKVIALNPNNPATGDPLGYSFVQVQFEVNVPYTKPDGTMGTYQLPPLILPKAEGQWVRSPTQVGDFGVTQAVDTSHGGVTGMSAGVSNTGTQYGNLSTLVFVPVPNTSFGPPPDPNRAWVNGVKGADISDTAQTATHVVAVPTVGAPGTIASTIHNPAGAGASTVSHVVDGVNNKVAQSLTNASGTFSSTVDGVAGAINHVVPTGGGVGLGAAAASLPSTAAALAHVDLNTFNTSLFTARLNDLTALVTAMIASGVPNAGTVLSNLATLGAIPVPAGSTTVKIKP
jgi:hypothetical protein